MMEKVFLEKCPFCGSGRIFGAYEPFVHIGCTDCGTVFTNSGLFKGTNEEKLKILVKVWNNRSDN